MICPVLYEAKGRFQIERTERLQEVRNMRLEEAYEGWEKLPYAKGSSIIAWSL